MYKKTTDFWLRFAAKSFFQLLCLQSLRSADIHNTASNLCGGNLVPRVLWLFGQRMGASRDSGVLEFSYRKISAVKQWKPLRGSQSKKNFFRILQSLYWRPSADQKARGFWVRDCCGGERVCSE